MTDEKTTAPAEQEPAPKRKKATLHIEGVSLTKMQRGAVKYPAALYSGEKPSKGDTLKFTLNNGVTYSGVVLDATEADGQVLVEFRDGLKPA